MRGHGCPSNALLCSTGVTPSMPRSSAARPCALTWRAWICASISPATSVSAPSASTEA
ncbi:Uncharacterised protein [Bordetella pertussis]|nr:Uncharacterised protein [Bordetella pertussis]